MIIGSRDKHGITALVRKHLKQQGIRIEYEGPFDVDFIAPRGKRFGNDTGRRHMEDIDMITEFEIIEATRL
jgi:hypothetical protein